MKKKYNGFTFIEVMMTLVIIIILAALAIPCYQSYLSKTERITAETALSKIAIALEQHYTINNTYKNFLLDNAVMTQAKNYQLEITSATDSEFIVSAIPQNNDKCGTLTLDSKGEKSSTTSNRTEECWS